MFRELISILFLNFITKAHFIYIIDKTPTTVCITEQQQHNLVIQCSMRPQTGPETHDYVLFSAMRFAG